MPKQPEPPNAHLNLALTDTPNSTTKHHQLVSNTEWRCSTPTWELGENGLFPLAPTSAFFRIKITDKSKVANVEVGNLGKDSVLGRGVLELRDLLSGTGCVDINEEFDIGGWALAGKLGGSQMLRVNNGASA